MAKTTTKPAPKPAATTSTAPSAKAAATGVTSTATATPTATKAPTLAVATPKPAGSCCGGHSTCATPSYEQIAQRAYEIWVAKGRPQAQDVENWKQAEADLKRGSLVNAA